MAVHIHPVEIPPRYYKPIGQIASGWNLTEALISSIVWHIHEIKDPKEGRLFVYRPASGQKLKIFKVSISEFSEAQVRDELFAFHRRAADLNTLRNKIVHGLWGRMPNEPKTWKIFFHRDTDDMILLKRELMTVAQVEAIAGKILQLNRDLKRWMAKHGVPPP